MRVLPFCLCHMFLKEYYELFPASRALLDLPFTLRLLRYLINELQGL